MMVCKLASLLVFAAASVSGIVRAADAPGVNLRRTVAVEVAEKTKDAVVFISTTKVITQRLSPFGDDPFWQQFDIGPGRVIQRPLNSLGSGFIVHPDGYVITNNHVVDRATEINVELLDGRKLKGELLSQDSAADLAIIRIKSDRPLPYLELGDSSDLMIGEPTIAVGNPLGFSHTVSTGIVSALHRELSGPNERVQLRDLIQTDAAINPGNSGGPLLNAYGQVIGINTAIRSDAQNIGFAIPVNKLRDMIPTLMNPAGISKVDVPLKLKEQRTMRAPSTIVPNITKAEGGPGIASICGQKPRDIIDAYAILLRQKPEARIEIAYENGQKSETLVARAVPPFDALAEASRRLGLVVQPVTPQLARQYGLETDRGMFVAKVSRDTPAANAGIQPGDVIVSLGPFRIATQNDFSTLMQHLPKEGKVQVGVVRGDSVGFGVLDL
jgi:serine protease Do